MVERASARPKLMQTLSLIILVMWSFVPAQFKKIKFTERKVRKIMPFQIVSSSCWIMNCSKGDIPAKFFRHLILRHQLPTWPEIDCVDVDPKLQCKWSMMSMIENHSYLDFIFHAGNLEERFDFLPQSVPWPSTQGHVPSQISLDNLQRDSEN